MKRERSAGAIIFRKEGSKIYYLLLHYESGHWDFPKGHVEKGEDERETVKREIKEETGIENIKFLPDFEEKIKYFYRKSYDKVLKSQKRFGTRAPLVLKEVGFYLVETFQKKVKISFEHLGFKWLEYKEAIERVTYKNAKEILKKAHEFLLKYEKEKRFSKKSI